LVGNARFARSWGKTILINAQMDVKRRSSYLSEKKGNGLPAFLKEQGFARSSVTEEFAQANN